MKPLFNASCLTLLFALFSCSATVLSAEYPSGIFISGGRTQEQALLNKPYVDGALIRVPWRDLEPRQGVYNWKHLDDEIARVKRAGKRYTLAILSGPSAPEWLYTEGAKAYEFSFSNPHAPSRPLQNKIPLPWDQHYIDRWGETIKAVAKRYRNDPDLYLVHITTSSQNGFEMQLPYKRGPRDTNNIPDWKTYGYTEQRYIDGTKQVISIFSEAFPKQMLDLEIHPVFESYRIPEELLNYGYSVANGRFGAFGAWLSNKNKPWEKKLHQLMTMYADQPNSFCNYQLIGNETRQAQRLGTGGLKGTVQLGLSQGCRYYEIWDIDLKNARLVPFLNQLHNVLQKGDKNL